MSHVDQNLSRVASEALPLAALCHRSTSGSLASCSSTSPIQPMVSVYYHAPNGYSSNGEFHPPKYEHNLFISWDVEMQSPGDIQMKTTRQ